MAGMAEVPAGFPETDMRKPASTAQPYADLPQRHTVVEMLAFIATAGGIGLSASVALGGMVLLLSDAATDSPIATAAAMHAGAVMRANGKGAR